MGERVTAKLSEPHQDAAPARGGSILRPHTFAHKEPPPYVSTPEPVGVLWIRYEDGTILPPGIDPRGQKVYRADY